MWATRPGSPGACMGRRRCSCAPAHRSALAGYGATFTCFCIARTILRESSRSSLAPARTASRGRAWRRQRLARSASTHRVLGVGDRPEDIGLAERSGHRDLPGTGDYQRPGVWSFPAWPPGPRSSWSASLYEFCLRSSCLRRPTAAARSSSRSGRMRARHRTSTPMPRRCPGPRSPSSPPGSASAAILTRPPSRCPHVLLRPAARFDRQPHAARSREGHCRATDLRPQVLSLSTNVELLTAIANDTGYENILVHQLQSQSEPGDVLLAVSCQAVRPILSARSPGPVTKGSEPLPCGLRRGAAKAWPRSASSRLHELRHCRACARP